MIPDEHGVTTGPDDGVQAHTDLDHQAGTWSAEEAKAFGRRTKAFEVLDEELWR